ncbi:MAG: MATE family efflux transporter [Bacteroidetes bacterium]|uniref:Multidrug-efflux transporter n=1 Tax=Candidatus Merdivivens pullistercoris TaxID=2840873 RepID=A0A9D9I3K5_9BACT|nr:MATE family efflux transporter [Candidatus Merdivivens pullistercoris]
MTAQATYRKKDIWKIAYPIMISLLMEQLIGMTDTAFMGRVGEVELGASAIGAVFYMMIFMMGFGFSVGAQIIIARRNGEGNYRDIGNVFFQGLYIISAIALVMSGLSLWFSDSLIEMAVSSPDVARAAEDYINYRVFGLLFAFAAAMFRAFFVGTTQTRTLTLNSIVMVLSNVLFNWILVFGKFGFPALGIAGAAIGSVLAEAVSLMFFILYTRFRVDCRKYGLDRIYRPSVHGQRSILKVSFWTMIQNFISFSTWFAFIIFVEHLGEHSLAVTNIVRNIGSLIFMIISAFASTCSSVTSNLIGAGRQEEVMPTIKRIIVMGYMFVIPLALLFSAFPELFARIYTNIPSLYEDVAPSVWVFCTSLIFTVPGNILFQAVSGTGNTRKAFALEIGTLMVYLAYSAFITMHLRLDVSLCWTTEHVYYLLIGILCYSYIKKGKWETML